MGALDGRVALVTGASRGIGAGIAQRFAAEGATVAITARTADPDPRLPAGTLKDTLAAIERVGGRGFFVAADLSDGDDRARVVPAVEAELGPVEILVNNAAAAIYQPNSEISLKRRRLSYEINLHAPIDLAQAVIPHMRERGEGWIINISSATKKHPKGPPFGPGPGKLGYTIGTYGSSKSALDRYTTDLAGELYQDHIAVNSLAPVAAVRTPGADLLVGDVMDANPDIVEPLELFVEAALALAVCDPESTTGRLLYSRPYLEEIGREVRALDGGPFSP